MLNFKDNIVVLHIPPVLSPESQTFTILLSLTSHRVQS